MLARPAPAPRKQGPQLALLAAKLRLASRQCGQLPQRARIGLREIGELQLPFAQLPAPAFKCQSPAVALHQCLIQAAAQIII
jgi:hypothetical protein